MGGDNKLGADGNIRMAVESDALAETDPPPLTVT